MIWSRIWPWARSRGKQAPVLRVPGRVHLNVEVLESRLVPSATTNTPYDLWRTQTYRVDDVAVANIAPTNVTTQATPMNSSFGNLIGLPSAFGTTTYRGTGYSVVVIDTGIDYRHADLGGGFGAGRRVIAGWDFVNNDADPLDDNGHGTHVAGIIGSSSATYSGVAPGVNLIALKVLGADGSGSFGAVEDALKWVVANQSRYNIVAINMSLGAGNYTTNPYTFLEDEFASLKSQGVFTAVAAGNGFYSYNSQVGLDYPAISSQVVSVGAVWASNFGTIAWASGARDETTAADRIASFSQRGPALSLMAPGAIINSTYLNNTYRTMAGTSMASPVAAGAAAIIHQAMDAKNLTANQDTILALMKKTGATVADGDDENDNVVNTGLSFKRLNLGAALADLGPTTPPPAPTNSAPVLQAISAQNVVPGKSVVTTLNATDANGDVITFSACVVGSMAQTAYQLDRQLGLTFTGNYSENTFGQGERWLSGTCNKWYCILPNGEFRVWVGSMAATLQPANLLAKFDVRYFNGPGLLWNAQSVYNSLPTLSIVGNKLTITAPAGVNDSFTIEVTASDGKASTKQSFAVTAQNTPPVLSAIADKTAIPGSTTIINLNAIDADGGTLTYSARVVGSFAQIAFQVDQQYGLYSIGSYHQGVNGYAERWMRGSSGDWFCVLPNGELRRWNGSMADTMKAVNLVATFDVRYYNDPSMIWNAKVANTTALTMTVIGNQLRIVAPAGVSEIYQIEVTASDGNAASQQTFALSVRTNTAPAITTIPTQSMQTNRSQTLTLSTTDGQGAVVSFQTAIVGTFANAPATLSLVGNQLTINTSPDFVGAFDIRVIGSDGFLSSTMTFRVNVAASAVFSRMQGDVNGDGLKDTIFFNQDGSVWVNQTQANGGFINKLWANWSPAASWKSVSVGDFDGDGKSDIMGFATSGAIYMGCSTGSAFAQKLWAQWSQACSWASIQFADFNGDGKTDIVGMATGGSIWVGLSNSTTFTTSLWSQWSKATSWKSLTVADIDGDGKQDIVGLNTNGQYYVAYSTTTSFRTTLWSAATPPKAK
ncbi:MAG: hypothetical protein EXS16_04540 [Gemmataceae bacterium]|nr:hypothetical protein [Gemmataceae bacterium]